MENITEVITRLKESMGDVSKYRASTPEEDAARKAKYEADLAEKRSYLRGLRNAMAEECTRFNADWSFKSNTPDPLPSTAPIAQQPLIAKRETLRLTQTEWDALHVQAAYDMHSVAQYVSVIVRRHLQKEVATIQRSSNPRPIGRPPAPKPPMYLQPWNPNIWEDELEAWHTTAAERNPKHTAAEVRVAHDLYLATLFAHLQRVGFPHPFKAGFTAI
jgi:hypothetical protein